MKLGEICEINTGLVLSRKRADIDFEIIEKYKVLSLNNIDEYGEFIGEEFEVFESNDKLDQRYFTEEGDILLRLNSPYTALYIDKSKEGYLIPSYFVSIDVNNKEYLPEYIAWYLNTEKIKKDFFRSQSGTLIPSINQRLIRELIIPKVSLDKQKTIANLNRLYLKERKLLKQLIKEKDNYFKGVTQELLKDK